MKYNGPQTRHYASYEGNNFEVTGRVNYIEQREILLKQDFEVKQFKIDDTALVPNYFYEPGEKAVVDPAKGEPLLMERELEFDRLTLASTMVDMKFRPENSRNFTSQDVEVERRLTPFLATHTAYESVTAKPTVIAEQIPTQNEFTVQTGFHGRFWFGTIANGVAFDANDDTAFGVYPIDMPPNAVLNIGNQPTVLGYQNLGEITFTKVDGKWRCKSFPLDVPLDRVFGYAPDIHAHCTVPTLELVKTGRDYYLDNVVESGIADTSVDRGATYFHAIGGNVDETRAIENMYKIPIGTVRMAGNHEPNSATTSTLYWFIPHFRFREGNALASYAKPRRLVSRIGVAPITAALRNAAYFPNNVVPYFNAYHVPVPANPAAALNENYNRQGPFWADYFTTRYAGDRYHFDLVPVARFVQAGGVNYLEWETVADGPDDSQIMKDVKANAALIN